MVKIRPVVRLGFPLILPVLLVVLLALAPRLAVAAPGGSIAKDRQSGKVDRLMAQTQAAGAHHVEIPPLDMRVPAKIETATFALG